MDIDELRDFEELFSSNGWKRVVEQAKLEIDGIKDTLASQISHDQAQFFRGQIDQLLAVIFMEQNFETMLQVEEDNADL